LRTKLRKSHYPSIIRIMSLYDLTLYVTLFAAAFAVLAQ